MTVREAPDAESAPPSATPTAARSRPVVLVGLLVALGLALYWAPLRGLDLDAMNGYGLISILPPATLAGLVVLIAAYMMTLAMSRPHRLLLLAQLVLAVFALHGITQVVEPYARFPTAWTHAGFIEFITRTQTVDTGLDARYSWPGFFALVAFLMKATGQQDIEPWLRWAPLVMNLAFLAPYYLILRVMRATWRAKWFAAWLLVVANWVGQDYLAPQAFGFLLYLLFVAILVNWFRHQDDVRRRTFQEGRRRTAETRERTGPRWAVYNTIFGSKDPGELPPREVGYREHVILLFLATGLLLVATVSHQLTPFLMIIACAGLVVMRRCSARGLPILGGVIFVAWVSFMTVVYWAGRKQELFGSLGKVTENVGGSVAGRLNEVNPQVTQVQQLRIALFLLVCGLAALGLLRRRHRGIDDRVALVLFVVPVTSFGLQNYGGEIALRIYFFMLPGACLLAAYLFFPQPFDTPAVRDPRVRIRLARLRAGPRRHWPAVALATVFAFLLCGGFMVVRYGNEKYEQIRPAEVRAYDTVLRQTPRTVTLVWLTADDPSVSITPVAPWGYRSMERFDYRPVRATNNPTDIAAIVAAMRSVGPHGYFITTRGHEAFNELTGGLGGNHADRMRKTMAASPLLRTVYSHPDAAVFALRRPPNSPEPQPVRPPEGVLIGSTPWTPAGLVYVPVLLGVLVAREMRRLRLAPGEYHRLRPLTVLTIPLLVGVLAVIIERFIVIS
ncbi:hypothetical protein DPM19_24570 [Actinomadura craniellae]|uniref:Glycosyltransferase RgtA/B/C/D-like domain-containing protein n=1 Tax=Actinomadura craniellae TaxID=2231787 RepID=A0A365GZT0_9ACTN|nr:hypothetical protein [Actinomadura craniellae]RAY12332.1 hypothetical protein DPM19_24570 [Actinomadura craniellae]